jgi:hypothetical protein
MTNRRNKNMPDLNAATDALRDWYHTEVRALTEAAIEACVGRLLTECPKGYLSGIPSKYRASARASFVPHRVATEDRTGKDGFAYTVQHREREEGVDPREFLTEWVDETTDGHEFVIYTYKAKCVLLASDNEDAIDDLGMDGTHSVEARACFALRADVWAGLEARDDEWDVEDPTPEDEPPYTGPGADDESDHVELDTYSQAEMSQRKSLRAVAEITLEVEPEYIEVRGNAGDEAEALRQLALGLEARDTKRRIAASHVHAVADTRQTHTHAQHGHGRWVATCVCGSYRVGTQEMDGDATYTEWCA